MCILGLGKMFKILDDDRSNTLSEEELAKCLNEYRMNFSKEESKILFDRFDRDGNGSIDYDEFLRFCRGSMNKFRVNLVKKVYAKFDKNHDGVVDINDIRGTYDCSKHPAV